jgi:hypothetical protein
MGYFLTANHCMNASDSILGTQTEASTMEFYWFYQTSTCDGAPPSITTVPRTIGGADLISNQTRNSGNDHAFVRIRRSLPGGLTFLGWDTTPFSRGNDAIGIHHPDGSFKRISFGRIGDSTSNYWDVLWSSGTTEGGSSGSPIFDSAHRVRGQLWGGVRGCPAPGVTISKDYGRLNVTYPTIRRWMEIGGTIHVNSSHTGAEEGTPTSPFRTASAANTFAWNGSRIKFKAGAYPGPLTFNKAVTLIADGGLVTIGH